MTDTPASLTRSDMTRYARIDGASAALIALCDLCDSLIANNPDGSARRALVAEINRAATLVEQGQAWAAMFAVSAAPIGACDRGDCIALRALRLARQEAEGLTSVDVLSRLPEPVGVAQ